jgi:tetrapyrrole methylase family protein / MazG family protein
MSASSLSHAVPVDETLKQLPPCPPQWLQALGDAARVIAHLRHPQEGCPWDLKQTHQSLKPYMLEEAYEAVAAVDEPPLKQADASKQVDPLCDELGDVLLQVLLHAQIATDNGRFTLADVASNLSAKMIRRHPHVFNKNDTNETLSAEGVVQQWQQIKEQEQEAASPTEAFSLKDSILAKASKPHLPALMRAQKVSSKAVSVGFAWPDFNSLWRCVMSEYDELQEAIEQKHSPTAIAEEMGDCLFASVNLARELGLEAEVTLSQATDKFIKRFMWMEANAQAPLETLNFETWDQLWKRAKQATEVS